MGVLEIIAEEHLGKKVLSDHAELKSGLRKIENSLKAHPDSQTTDDEKHRIAAIVELCFEYDRESDKDERENILRTLEEIAKNAPMELSNETIENWGEKLAAKDHLYAELKGKDAQRMQAFLKKYFSFRAKANLKTQSDVAKKSGISRTHLVALESGEHFPQQKTIQKLAAAFGVDVTELM